MKYKTFIIRVLQTNEDILTNADTFEEACERIHKNPKHCKLIKIYDTRAKTK